MEELRTSEVLEKEILEDARKRADRIIRNADTEIRSMGAEWEEKKHAASLELEARYREKVREASNEVESVLPLEIKRRSIEFYDTTIRGCLDRYFEGLPREERLSFVKALFGRKGRTFADARIRLRYGGMTGEEARRLIEGDAPGVTVVSEETFDATGVIVELENGRVRFSATFEEIRRFLLESRREELFTSLFGER